MYTSWVRFQMDAISDVVAWWCMEPAANSDAASESSDKKGKKKASASSTVEKEYSFHIKRVRKISFPFLAVGAALFFLTLVGNCVCTVFGSSNIFVLPLARRADRTNEKVGLRLHGGVEEANGRCCPR